MKRYLVTVMRNPGFDAGLIPAHGAFLDGLRERRQLELAGPFTDASGGAYLLLADDLQVAEALAFTDPLHASGSSSVSVREWNAR
ncbi:MAG TPA: YciI family protein [Oleiagrimonas sp.]|nr:YciI family protein [Oleiagrimonas sp.]